MKKLELEKHRKMTPEALDKESITLRGKINQARIDIAMGKEKNLRKVKSLRHDLAQILTIKNEGRKDK